MTGWGTITEMPLQLSVELIVTPSASVNSASARFPGFFLYIFFPCLKVVIDESSWGIFLGPDFFVKARKDIELHLKILRLQI